VVGGIGSTPKNGERLRAMGKAWIVIAINLAFTSSLEEEANVRAK